jgi:ATP-dependent DNA helicase RecG
LIQDFDIILSEGEGYDEIIRSDMPLDDQFSETSYHRFIQMAKISAVLDRDSILRNLGCASVSCGKACFTNAGALFFRDNEADVKMRHSGVVCALYKGLTKVFILYAKEYCTDIISNIDNAMGFLRRNLRLRYEIKTLRREEILELPEDALREAVINAVCHRDYFELGARVMVEIFDDRVEITNPGGAPKGITTQNFGTVSITRNPIIASLLHRSEYIEQMGTGIERMRQASREANVEEPRFETNGFFKVTFKRALL